MSFRSDTNWTKNRKIKKNENQNMTPFPSHTHNTHGYKRSIIILIYSIVLLYYILIYYLYIEKVKSSTKVKSKERKYYNTRNINNEFDTDSSVNGEIYTNMRHNIKQSLQYTSKSEQVQHHKMYKKQHTSINKINNNNNINKNKKLSNNNNNNSERIERNNSNHSLRLTQRMNMSRSKSTQSPKKLNKLGYQNYNFYNVPPYPHSKSQNIGYNRLNGNNNGFNKPSRHHQQRYNNKYNINNTSNHVSNSMLSSDNEDSGFIHVRQGTDTTFSSLDNSASILQFKSQVIFSVICIYIIYYICIYLFIIFVVYIYIAKE